MTLHGHFMLSSVLNSPLSRSFIEGFPLRMQRNGRTKRLPHFNKTPFLHVHSVNFSQLTPSLFHSSSISHFLIPPLYSCTTVAHSALHCSSSSPHLHRPPPVSSLYPLFYRSHVSTQDLSHVFRVRVSLCVCGEGLLANRKCSKSHIQISCHTDEGEKA